MSGNPSSENKPSIFWSENEIMDSDWTQETSLGDEDNLLASQRQSNITTGGDSGDAVRNSETKFTRRQIVTLISMSLTVFINWLTYSVITVLYPTVAIAKGMSQTAVGFVFSAYTVTSSVAYPFWGKILPSVGCRFLFLVGSFVTGCSSLLFGLLIYMPTDTTFEVFSYILRVMEGLGASACVAASSATLACTFPESTGAAVGVIQMVLGASSGIGPAIGGLLYDLGGFILPFFVVGGCVLTSVVVNYFLMPQQGSSDDRAGSISSIVRIPAVWFVFFAVVGATTGISFLYPTLTPYLEEELDFTVVEASVTYLLSGLLYAVIATLWGRIADKTEATRLMIVLGEVFCAVSFLLLGPSPILHIRPNVVLVVLTIPCTALSTGLIVMSSVTDLFISVRWYGIKQDFGNSAIVCGLFQSAITTGVIFGPVLGGALVDSFGFGYGTTIVACGYVVLILIISVFGLWEYRCGRGRRVPKTRLDVKTSSTEADEETLLLSEEI